MSLQVLQITAILLSLNAGLFHALVYRRLHQYPWAITIPASRNFASIHLLITLILLVAFYPYLFVRLEELFIFHGTMMTAFLLGASSHRCRREDLQQSRLAQAGDADSGDDDSLGHEASDGDSSDDDTLDQDASGDDSPAEDSLDGGVSVGDTDERHFDEETSDDEHPNESIERVVKDYNEDNDTKTKIPFTEHNNEFEGNHDKPENVRAKDENEDNEFPERKPWEISSWLNP